MIILHDSRIPFEYINGIERCLPEAELLPFKGGDPKDTPGVYDSISGHPDIYFFQIDKDAVIYAPSINRECYDLLAEKEVHLIPGESVPSGVYPHTAIYNAVRTGKYVFHNFKITDNVIKEEIKKRGLIPVEVNQGYARCSFLPVGEDAVITSDKGMAKAAQESGLEVLCVSCDSIVLPGEKHGFLPGASGVLPDGNILFLGDISRHPGYLGIREMLERYGIQHYFLKDLPLYDAGSLFVF